MDTKNTAERGDPVKKGFWTGLVLVLISGFVFGVMPLAVTFCRAGGASKEMILTGRYLALALVLLPVAIRRKNTFRLLFKNLWRILLLSAASAVTPLLLYSAYEYQSTGLTTSLHFLYPVAVMVLERIFYKTKLTRRKALCLALCAAGVVLMVEPGVTASARGLLFTAASVLTFSLYILWMDHLRPEGVSSLQMIFCMALVGAALLLPYAIVAGGFSVSVSAAGIAAVAGTALVCAVCGTLFLSLGIRKTDAQTAAIASTLEPITSVALGVLFLNESLSWRTAAGSVLILAAVVLISLPGRKNP